jgi:2-hydroxycyclohexanecarboxyl-CoA dehydrogenase
MPLSTNNHNEGGQPMINPMSLQGRVALITGAGQGVGRQTALHFAANQCDVVIVNDYFEQRAQNVAAEVQALGCRAVVAQGDVTRFDQVSRWLPDAVAKAGGLHIVVNNAGNAGPEGDAAHHPRFATTDPDNWDAWLGTNLFGVLNVCRQAIPLVQESGAGGSIVNIISDAGRTGQAGLAVYSAAKGGVASFSRSLAKELGRDNIRVNAVALSAIRTPGVAALIPDEEIIKRVARQYPMGRIGEPSDAANMILFLASEASNWITAQTYPVNGGYTNSY